MRSVIIAGVLLFLLPACGQEIEDTTVISSEDNKIIVPIIHTSGMTIEERFNPPQGYSRITQNEASFGAYLRKLALQPAGSEVKYYDGRTKSNSNAYCAVVDKEIGTKDLHQCADAVMRLRAEYLWEAKKYNDIHFNFTNGFRADYYKWMKGQRISVRGNTVSWYSGAASSVSYESFWNYLERVFMYAGTLSLAKELNAVSLSDMKIGDVFIQGGSPGHAIIVVDMVINGEGEKLFMLAQSYMPAQDIQILNNKNNEEMSPWYNLDFTGSLRTPEWTFTSDDLKRF